jgi:hypothetical protein
MFQNVFVGAAGFFQAVGQLCHPIKCSIVVDVTGKGQHTGRDPGTIKGRRAERVAD